MPTSLDGGARVEVGWGFVFAGAGFAFAFGARPGVLLGGQLHEVGVAGRGTHLQPSHCHATFRRRVLFSMREGDVAVGR